MTTRPEAAPTAGGKRKGAGRPKAKKTQETAVVDEGEHGSLGGSDNQSKETNDDSRVRGEDPAYLAARIARDAPEVHEADGLHRHSPDIIRRNIH